MIYLTKGQKLFENTGMVVYGDTGYYNDGDVVICAPAYSPDEPACGYEAKYIAYGTIVYGMTDEDKLTEQLKKIDPKTLFGKNKETVITDNIIENIETADSQIPPNNPVAETVSEPVAENNASDGNPVSPITPEELGITPATQIETSTTTHSIIPDTSTSTPATDKIVPAINNVIEELNQISDIVEQATTTPPTGTSTNLTI